MGCPALLADLDRLVRRHAAALDDLTGRIELDAHVHGRAVAEAEVALGRRVRIITMRGLPRGDDDLLVRQQGAGALLADAQLGAGGGAVAGRADRADAQPVPRRQLVAHYRHALV